MFFEIKLHPTTYNPQTQEYEFTFDYEVKSIPTQIFRFKADSYQRALSLVDPKEILYLNEISSPTLGEIID